MPGVPHTGVVATLADGSRRLVHKTAFGTNSGNTTVITSASDMSSKWKVGENQSAQPGTTVNHLIKAGGGSYNVTADNCWTAQDKIMNKATGQ